MMKAKVLRLIERIPPLIHTRHPSSCLVVDRDDVRGEPPFQVRLELLGGAVVDRVGRVVVAVGCVWGGCVVCVLGQGRACVQVCVGAFVGATRGGSEAARSPSNPPPPHHTHNTHNPNTHNPHTHTTTHRQFANMRPKSATNASSSA